MEIFDLNKFYNIEELSSMIICKNISMAYIYETMKNKDYTFYGTGIEITNSKDGLFDIHYNDIEIEYIFEEPMKIKISNKIIDIIL